MAVFLITRHDSPVQTLVTKAFVSLVGISTSLGVQTSYGLNPARDFDVAASIFGYPGVLSTVRHGYWFRGAILGPLLGAILGGASIEGVYRLREVILIVRRFGHVA